MQALGGNQALMIHLSTQYLRRYILLEIWLSSGYVKARIVVACGRCDVKTKLTRQPLYTYFRRTLSEGYFSDPQIISSSSYSCHRCTISKQHNIESDYRCFRLLQGLQIHITSKKEMLAIEVIFRISISSSVNFRATFGIIVVLG